jgi:hypothetical protein
MSLLPSCFSCLLEGVSTAFGTEMKKAAPLSSGTLSELREKKLLRSHVERFATDCFASYLDAGS